MVLAAAPRQRAPARPGEAPPPLQQSPLPILAFMLAAQSGGGRGRSYYPYVGLRAPLALQVRALGALGALWVPCGGAGGGAAPRAARFWALFLGKAE